jgi:hypothetical protein
MTESSFTALVLSLPSRNKTARMRIWRALRGLGCGVLRDGVYLLPPAEGPRLIELESQVKAAGGFAMALELNLKTAAQLTQVRKLFDRTNEYAALINRMTEAHKALTRIGAPRTAVLVKRLRRSLEDIAKTDFYPGEAKRQAEEALARLENALEGHSSPDEPRAARGKLRRLDPREYQGRVWTTRKGPWIDRLASAWLIKRFIDRRARFRWVDKPKGRAKDRVGFDFDGADFTHLGRRVTFEVLAASFGLDVDPALRRLAATIHYLDIGGVPVADAGGLEMILKGARDKARSDDELLAAAATVFDHVYSAYSTLAAS